MVGDFSRKRMEGPGCLVKTTPIGVKTTYKPWLLPELVTWFTENTSLINYAGWKKVTLDNVHRAERRKKLYKLRKAIRLKKGVTQDVLLQLQALEQESLDDGGDLSIFEVFDNSYPRGVGTYVSPNKVFKYEGGFGPTTTGWSASPSNVISSADMDGVGSSGKFSGEFGTASELGPSAWRRFAPKLYAADMGQFVGEIREVLPMMRTTAKSFADIWRSFRGRGSDVKFMSKSDANAWLNFQFGWKPFLGDMESLIKSFFMVQDRLQQCKRDNGQFVRRKGLISSTVDNPTRTLLWDSHNVSYASNGVTPRSFPEGLSVGYPAGSNYVSETKLFEEKSEKIWFSGCFRYWVPSFDGPDNLVAHVQNYMRMYGLRISPLLIWNLTPWSWLADWTGNVGANIANYTSAVGDNLTAKYAYIMKETHVALINRTWVNLCPPYGMQNFEWTRGYSVKTRRHASQFGFTIDCPDFTARQWSILAALGISRLSVSSR